MYVNLTKAAQLAGVGRSTIYRAIADGRISKSTGKDGKPRIDVAELERVFDLKGEASPQTDQRVTASPIVSSVNNEPCKSCEALGSFVKQLQQELEESKRREHSYWQLIEKQFQPRLTHQPSKGDHGKPKKKTKKTKKDKKGKKGEK